MHHKQPDYQKVFYHPLVSFLFVRDLLVTFMTKSTALKKMGILGKKGLIYEKSFIHLVRRN